MDLIQLSELAIEAALAAGKHIQQYIGEDVLVENKVAGSGYASQVVTKVDRESEAIILERLLPSCHEFGIALLSEETEDDGGRFEKDFFWCVDPMDGTLAFINRHPGFSVSIALLSRAGVPQIGVVYDPSSETLYHAIKGHGAFKDRQAFELKYSKNQLTYVTDRKLIDTPRFAEIEQLLKEQAEGLGIKEIKEISGSGAVLNAILVLENGPACMLKMPKKAKGGGSIWDYAATVCIYQELALEATNFQGGSLNLNPKGGTFMNKQGVCFKNLGVE